MLLDNHNIGPFLFTFLPALIYALVIYTYSRCKISLKKALIHFTIGTCGIFIAADMVPFVFPNWRNKVNGDEVVSLFTFAFVQVAFLEEIIKFVLFKSSYSEKKEEFNPLTTMFYCVCVSCGFAVAENLIYATMFGTNVLLIRAFTAIPMHIIFGIIMGYFIALGKIKAIGKYGIESFSKKFFYSAIGVLAAAFLHGLYDFVGFQSLIDKIWWIIIFSIVGSYSLISDLILKSKNL